MSFSGVLKKAAATVAVAVIAIQGLTISASAADRTGLVAMTPEPKVQVVYVSGRLTPEFADAAASYMGEDIIQMADAMKGVFSELIGINGLDQTSFKETINPNHITTKAGELAFVDLDGVMWVVGNQSELKLSMPMNGKIEATLISGAAVCMGGGMTKSEGALTSISLTDGRDNYISCKAGMVFGARKTDSSLVAVSYSKGTEVELKMPSNSVKSKYSLDFGGALKIGVNKAGYAFSAVPSTVRNEIDAFGEAAAITKAQGLDISYYNISLLLANSTEDFLVSVE